MKLLLSLLVVVVSFQSIPAQEMLRKGTIEYGGSASLLRRVYDDDNDSYHVDDYSTIWNLTPEIGYFVRDRLSVGADVLFQRWSSVYAYPSYRSEYNDQTIAFGPRATYYFAGTQRHAPFVTAGVRLGVITGDHESSSGSGGESSETYTDVHVGIGVLHVINRFVAVSTSLTFTAEDFHYESDYYSGSYSGHHFESDRSGNRLTLEVGFKLFHPRQP